MKTIRRIMKSIISVCIMLTISIMVNKSYAAELAVSANGNSVTISSQYTGKVNISVSGGTASQSSVWLENSSETVTISGVGASGATVTVTPATMSDSDGNAKTVSAKSVKIAGTSSTSRDNTTTNNTTNKNDTNKTDTNKTSTPSFKETNDTMYATGDINVRKSYSADSDKIGSLKAGDKVTRIAKGDNGWSKVSYNGSTGYIKTSLLTDEEQKKSDDKTLKSLSIEGLELNPAFDAEITDYAVTLDKDLDKLDIKAEATSEKAKVEITGNEELKDGDNVIKITVTAEDGTTRLYSITATKQSAAAATLSVLKIAGYTLNPTFSPEVKEYKLTILDANVDKLDITAETKIKDAKVEILGNSGLKDGDNIIQIKVTSPDGTKTETYKIVATKNASGTAAAATENKSSNWILYAGIAIITLLIIAIIVVIIISRRNAYYEDDEEYEDEEGEEGKKQPEDYSDLYGYSTKSEVKNSEPNVNEDNEKEKFINESIFGGAVPKAETENVEETPKYEDGFNYNPMNSQDIYGNDNKEAEEPTGIKDVDYYSNKVSEMFDAPEAGENKTTDDAFGYLPKDESVPELSDEYTPSDNNWSDEDYRPRRSKGKHAK
ncbi:MAG: cadherin-like beta sandwich domain-containing protein [Clostridia bacterium]|nr:cadherin-like beta sandwich domain-containing protein [Clostridia bacterium]